MKTYEEIQAFAKERRHYLAEIEMELSYGGESKWFSVAVMYSLEFGEFYIVSAHINCDGTYFYFPYQILDGFYHQVRKELQGIDELEEEREAQREAYLDQRRTA